MRERQTTRANAVIHPAIDKGLKGPKREVRLGAIAKDPAANSSILQRFAWEGKHKVSSDNKKMLRRFAGNRIYEVIDSLTRASNAIQAAIQFLRNALEVDEGFLDSKLVHDSNGELRRLVQEQGKRLQGLDTLLKSVQADRAQRIKDAVELEGDLERELLRQHRQSQKKITGKKKKKSHLRLDQNEEDGSPTVHLDPTLLGEATKALTLDPKHFPGAKQAKPKKQHTKP